MERGRETQPGPPGPRGLRAGNHGGCRVRWACCGNAQHREEPVGRTNPSGRDDDFGQLSEGSCVSHLSFVSPR